MLPLLKRAYEYSSQFAVWSWVACKSWGCHHRLSFLITNSATHRILWNSWWSPPRSSVYLFIGCICFFSLSSVNIPLFLSSPISYSGFPFVFYQKISSCCYFRLRIKNFKTCICTPYVYMYTGTKWGCFKIKALQFYT